MQEIKSIGLIAHDARKTDLVEWVSYNVSILRRHTLICTGTTGQLVQAVFDDLCPEAGKTVHRLKSGPLGGDQQMGSLIVDRQIDILVFFTDPMSMQPHDVDIKALMRICSIENIVVATTKSTADFVISSPLFCKHYRPVEADYGGYVRRLC